MLKQVTGIVKGAVAAVALISILILSGCGQITGLLATPTGQAATLEAISVMLTQTAAAPTATATHPPTPTPAPTVTPTFTPTVLAGSSLIPGAVGERVEGWDVGLIVLSVEPTTEVGRLRAAQDRILLDVEVQIDNAAAVEQPYNPIYFTLLDGEGSEYTPITNGVFRALLSGDLGPGEFVRGRLVFDVPVASGDYRLRYAPQVTVTEPAALWVALDHQQANVIPETGMEYAAIHDGLPGLGQRTEGSGIALVIDAAERADRLGITRPAEGNQLVVAQVTIENVSRTLTPYNPTYFFAADVQGYQYPSLVIPLETLLPAGSLQEGERVTGQVVFEVPADVSRLVLTYQPLVLMDGYEPLRVVIQY